MVFVEPDGELAKAELAGDRGGLLGDPLHQVTVGADRVGTVVDHADAWPVEGVCEKALGDRHADRVCDPLPKRTRGHLDPRRVAALGMSRSARTPLTKLLQVIQSEVE